MRTAICARGRCGLVYERGTSKVYTWTRRRIHMTNRDSYRTWLHDMVYYYACPSERGLKNVVCCARLDGGGVADVHQGKLESVKNDFKGLIGIRPAVRHVNQTNTTRYFSQHVTTTHYSNAYPSLQIQVHAFSSERINPSFKRDDKGSEWTCFNNNWKEN